MNARRVPAALRRRRRALAAVAVVVLALLTACSPDHSIVFITPRGPGSVIISHSYGESFCRVFEDSIEHCIHARDPREGEVVVVTATPDEGHEFIGWSPRHPTSWTQGLDTNANPLELRLGVGGRFVFYANFR